MTRRFPSGLRAKTKRGAANRFPSPKRPGSQCARRNLRLGTSRTTIQASDAENYPRASQSLPDFSSLSQWRMTRTVATSPVGAARASLRSAALPGGAAAP